MYKIDNDKLKKIKYKAVNDRASAMKKADRAFSLYIRTRDAQEYYGKAFKCISCGRLLPIRKADCGHYVNRRHMSLRYSEENCNAQCISCNRFDEGNIYNYRKGLFEKIGGEALLALEASKYSTRKISTFELEEIAKEYKKKVKEFPYQIKEE